MILYKPHVEQLRRLLQGPDPIVVLPEPDDAYLGAVLRRALQPEGVEVESIDASGTWTLLARERDQRRGEATLEAFLDDTAREVERRGHSCVLWLRDVSVELRRPSAMGRLKSVAARWAERSRRAIEEPAFEPRIVLSGQDAVPPPGLDHLCRITALERIHRGPEGQVFVEEILGHVDLSVDESVVVALTECLQGLSPPHAHRVIRRAVATGDDLQRNVRIERDRMLETGAIEVRSTSADRRFGGLDVLRAHLHDVAALRRDLRASTDASERERLLRLLPKGMLLLGPPGCGKSLAAEVTASVLGVPLLQLHVSRLMDRFLGGSEERLESALATARAAAPCVLWIDELEKALAGVGGDGEGGGTGPRMLGRLLTWMQENRHEIYVVATANSLDHVPPELLRRGRFDDHFLLDLPEAHERGEILAIALQEHGLSLSVEDSAHVQSSTAGFSGADLAALVQEAARVAWLADGALPQREHFDRVLLSFRPQSQQFASQNAAMKEKIARYEFRRASTKDGSARPVRATNDDSAAKLAAVLGTDGDATLVVHWDNAGGFALELSLRSGTCVAWLVREHPSGVTERLAAYEAGVSEADEVVLTRGADQIRLRRATRLRTLLQARLHAQKMLERTLKRDGANSNEGESVLRYGEVLWRGEWRTATVTAKPAASPARGRLVSFVVEGAEYVIVLEPGQTDVRFKIDGARCSADVAWDGHFATLSRLRSNAVVGLPDRLSFPLPAVGERVTVLLYPHGREREYFRAEPATLAPRFEGGESDS